MPILDGKWQAAASQEGCMRFAKNPEYGSLLALMKIDFCGENTQ
ncbi:hypothetical protein ACU8M5_02315 [Rhizobium leguminosarum]|nr:hypothetical protein [Rhizobium leguminosarum]MBP2485977.1 hypothetical protein [Rhizobium leguminosarum]